jgi:hypothetical protein
VAISVEHTNLMRKDAIGDDKVVDQRLFRRRYG